MKVRLAVAAVVLFGTLGLLPIGLAAGEKGGHFEYPAARKGEQVDDYHGTKVPDPYRWLEDVDSPETRQWVEAENRVTFGYLKKLPQRERLKARLTELWNFPKFGVPFKEGGRYFYTKNDGLQNQSVLYVQESLAGPARVLLDPNPLSRDGTVAVSATAVSDDGKLLAYGLAKAGSDWEELHVRNVADASDRPDLLKWVKFSGVGWTKDNRGFFYSRFDRPNEKTLLRDANRNHKLYYHVLGTPQEQDKLIYERPDDPKLLVDCGVSDDGRFALIDISRGGSKNAVACIDLRDPMHPEISAPVVKLVDNFDANWDFIDNDGTTLYFRTDSEAPRGRVVTADAARSDPVHWKTAIAEAEDAMEGAHLVGGRIVAEYLHNASSRLRVFALDGKPVRDVELPELGTASALRGKQADDEAFFAFVSFLRPATIFRYSVKDGTLSAFAEPKTKFDPALYETRQIWAPSKDGTKVPVFVTCRKGLKLDGTHPTLLTAYGGFKISITPRFGIPHAAWLEAGGVVAVANLRGGGEFGESWHQSGAKANKQHVFDDFIGAAEFLIHEKYTSPKKLAIMGGSNGGLLVGAVLNQRPDLFGAAIPAVGVMDMLRFHKFTIGSAWVEEYGSSDDAEQFKYLYAYSPLHNIKPGTHYPPTLILTADHDDRVVPGHSFKYAATIQAAQGGNAPVLIRIETDAGHGGGKPTTKAIEEAADVYAFLMNALGMGREGGE